MDIVDPKRLVRDEDDRDVAVGARAVLHDLAFGKPDERTWPERAAVRDQVALEHVHAVAARVRVVGVDDAGRIPHEPNHHAGLRIAEQLLAIERSADLLIESLFPRHLGGVDRDDRGCHTILLFTNVGQASGLPAFPCDVVDRLEACPTLPRKS